MKSCFVIFLSIFTISIVKSQSANNTIYLCKYDFIRQIDSTNKKSRITDIMYLEIGSESSKYYSHLKQLGIRNSSNDQAMKKPIEVMMQNHANYYSEAESEIITHFFKSGKIKVIDQFKNTYCYTVPIIVPDWKIQRDTITILKQLCQKATAFYKGRHYIAWFASSIPLKLGPWEFTGLPGLILRVTDTEEQFVFECTSLTANGEKNNIYHEYSNCQEISQKKLKELKRLRAIDLQTFDQIEYGVTWTQKNTDGTSVPIKRKLKPYNPIDLSN